MGVVVEEKRPSLVQKLTSGDRKNESISFSVDGVRRARSWCRLDGLQGISSVSVLIETFGPDEAHIGLQQDAVRSEVSLRLRDAGLQVISPEQLKQRHIKDAVVYLDVGVTPNGLAATVLAQFMQVAYLARNSSPVTVVTWSKVSTLSHPSPDTVRSAVKDLIDKFLTAWLAQNPRRVARP
jgi:hypothetical protein